MKQISIYGWKATQYILWILIVMSMSASPLWAFNSEEHKLMGDMAVSEIRLDTSIELPYPTRFVASPISSHLQSYTAAKNFAVGFATNTPSDFDTCCKYKKKIQDNSYPPGSSFAQLEGNKKIWIPPVKYLRDNGLYIMGYTNGSGNTFTFGDLMSIYGDYRRTTYCDADGKCYLTDANINNVSFMKGWDCYDGIFWQTGMPDGSDGFPLYAECGWRPNFMATASYLRHIAAGVWPPYGLLGNTVSNTADNVTDYHEGGWWGDEMMRIASTNDWHFSNGAISWYIGMHRLALHYADAARADPKLWNTALHYEASALNSLSDLFAFGHIVTSRDETSHAVMKADTIYKNSLLNHPAYQWMGNSLNIGGAQRDGQGRIILSATLPPITDLNHDRNDFMPSYLAATGYSYWGKVEHDYHDQFNNGGAIVRNLMGDSLTIYGDGKLKNMTDEDKDVLKNAIRTSVRSLFDAYVKLERYGATVETIGAKGSDYFNALRYIPVYVESTPGGRFTGEWTRYAGMINEITGAKTVPNNWESCQMPYINGGKSLPSPSASVCDSFPAVAANTAPSEPQLISPINGTTGVGQPTTFEWSKSIDPDGDTAKYDLVVCDDPSFPASCGVSLVLASTTNNGIAVASASGMGLILFAAGFVGSAGRRRRVMLPLGLILLVGLLLSSCGSGGNSNSSSMSYTRTDLLPATTYSWKVIAYDNNGASTSSTTSSFNTQ